MDDVITKNYGRELKIRMNYIDHLIHVQETLDEEVMVTTLTFDECFKIANQMMINLEKIAILKGVI